MNVCILIWRVVILRVHTYTVATHPCHIPSPAQARPMMLCIYTSSFIITVQFTRTGYSKLSKAGMKHWSIWKQGGVQTTCTCHGYTLGLTWTMSIVGDTHTNWSYTSTLFMVYQKWVQLNHLDLFNRKGSGAHYVRSDDIHNVNDISYKFEDNLLRKREIFLIKVNSWGQYRYKNALQKCTSRAITALILQCHTWHLVLCRFISLSDLHYCTNGREFANLGFLNVVANVPQCKDRPG